jgi:signal transduction histidine kinase
VIVISAVPASGGGYLLAGRALRPIKAAMDGQRAFIADASHELRTPVAVVRTNAELLERHMESGRIWQAEGDSTAVRDILSETERLGKMVGQMLTLAQSDAGQSILSQTDLILGELVEDAARSLRPLAAAKGVLMTVNAPPDVRVHGDGERLREVVVTVLDNAIKYTGAGGSVSISVKREHRKALVTVTDSGVGIPAEALRHVFEHFYRVDKARSRDEGGTGLGLAIARQVVEAHGGHISIESEPGRGTTVIVELRAL